MRTSTIELTLLVGVALGSMSAKADVVRTWYLEGVSFPSSGPVTGSFNFDATTNIANAVSVTTGLGTFTYPFISDRKYLDFLMASNAGSSNLTNALLFGLDLYFPMTDAGGTIALFDVGIFSCADATCGIANGIPGEDDPGYLGPPAAFISTNSPTPEPASEWLVGSTVLFLFCVWIYRRVDAKRSVYASASTLTSD